MVGLIRPIAVAGAEQAATTPSGPVQTESTEQRDARIKWWRDARFGMFIHWSPCAISGKELSWSRRGSKPLDITGNPAGYVEDPDYDNLYKKFNPTQYDARRWVKIAQDAGMKYMVLTCKHHEGFSMFDTKLSDYNIMNTPFHRDVVKELADACHEAAMRFGVYYSPRDWHHPDYGIGDNRKYVAFMNGQLRELLTHYGKVDLLWFDSYGNGDLVNFWRIGETWDLIQSLQPQILVNNRLAVLAGYNRQPPEYCGDFDTPEQTIGRMQTGRPWESCMCLVGNQWSWKPYGHMDTFEEVVRDLASCATGDGNLLLDIGPMPTGEIEPRQADRLKEVGDWLNKYGQSIYETRGGPFHNSSWGGSTYRGKTVYLHVFDWQGDTLRLNPIEEKITAAEALTGGELKFDQGDKGIDLHLAKGQHDKTDTIIELTLDRPVSKQYATSAQRSIFEDPGYGKIISAEASFTQSSSSSANDHAEDHPTLFTGKNRGFAFHTADELNPWIVIDLGRTKTVCGVRITNRPDDNRATGLRLSISEDGQNWKEVWEAKSFAEVWDAPVTQVTAGAEVPGRLARYLKLALASKKPGAFLLRKVEVFGQE